MGGWESQISSETVYLIKVTLPDGKIKTFRSDELNVALTLERFRDFYGDKIQVEQILLKKGTI